MRKQFFILFLLLLLSSFGLRISFVWGSQRYFFSLLAILLPMVGVLVKTKKTVGIVGGYFGIKALFGLMPFTFGLPSLCAAANWTLLRSGELRRAGPSARSVGLQKCLLNVVLPLVCMKIFIAHPVGHAAWMYSLYWLIPVGLYLFKKDTVLAVSLSSSFIAHAVGSIFWLFFMPMSPECWVALIPIVAVERLLFAVASVAAYKGIKWFLHLPSIVIPLKEKRSEAKS